MADIEIIKGADNGNPPDTLREMYPKINRNFQRVNSELTGHVTSTTAHKAEDITYSGIVPGSNVKVAVDNLNTRISEIVAQSGDDITELVDARDGYDVLGDRLNASDENLASVTTRLNGRSVNVLFPPPPLVAAKGDGVTNDTAAIQGAINTGRKVVIPYTENGYVVGKLTIGDNTEIEGTQMATIYCSDSVLFEVSSVGFSISNLKVNMNDSPSDSTAILLKTTTKVISNIRINKMWFVNCYSAIQDESGSTNYLENTVVEDIKCILTKGIQIYIHRSRGFLTFREIAVDHSFNTTPVTWRGVVIEDFQGIELEKIDILGPISSGQTPVYQPSAIGLYIKGGESKASVWLTRILVDTVMGDGVYIENVVNLVVNGLEVYQPLGKLIDFKNVTVGQLNNIFVVGGKGKTGSVSSANGITFDTCTKLSVSNIISSDNTGTGVVINNSSDNIFNNVAIRNNNNYGWYETGDSNRNIVTGANLSDNNLGGLTQSGSASAFTHWIYNGTYRPHDVGAVTV